jgi:ABC-type polysaccharide/polyol phosphate export permease
MVQREIKIRYKNSALGFLWSLLNPLVTVLVLTFVLTNFLRQGSPPSTSAYILAAYLPFVFFQLCVMDSAQSILGAMPLIKKIYFPREILPIASVISNFIHLVLAMAVFFGYLLLAYLIHPGEWPFQIGTLYLPFLLLITFFLALGCAFIVSALNTFYEDVKYIAGIGLWLMFFLCPIMYFGEDVAYSHLNTRSHGWVYVLYNLNPLSALATAYRKTLLAPPKYMTVQGVAVPTLTLNWHYVEIATAESLILLIAGYAVFNRLKWKFVERP